MNFPLEKLDFISGDFDSHLEIPRFAQKSEGFGVANDNFEIIETPDQNKTDFHKALEIIIEKGVKNVDVFGGSGSEQDHFLGNLSVAFFFKEKLNLKFFDEFSSYYFIPKKFSICDIKGKMISLFPFPFAKNIRTKGLKWEWNNEDLIFGENLGIRNIAEDNEVSIQYEDGGLLVFVEKKYLEN